ncbi:unnamed protein product (macronuclear) [Paramecium tetraurelia]|uniref:Uncharacterized protein n=1 Tax=Paramecium tetraurelia TaxID=5888 RepID=A0DFU1_PARTE|nr:uncharacterized protein GSPATT00016721001 [Paramecium tetraurelia]CAK81908.1 unnamed protein product [Paramecium tetraurelia]|eukprot:XP_001449305.1 hypothetical protein (macronuclear) [Paramecium tetraurelia strain d4-2]
MLFQRQSLPALNAICYHSNNEECELQLRPLYLLIRENQIDVQQENITLVGLFKLLKIWKLDIPFSILAKLMLNANKYCNQQLNQMINQHSFHQLMHNPQLQIIYRKKPKSDVSQLIGNNAYLQNCQFSTPQTIVGLFSRLGELIQRKQIYLKINNENLDAKDKYSYIIKMMQNTPRDLKINPVDNVTEKQDSLLIGNQYFSTQSKVDSILSLEDNEENDDQFPQINKPIKQKFQKLQNVLDLNDQQFKMNHRMRKMHTTMMKHMIQLKQNQNVNKINKLIQQTQGKIVIKLPEI